MAEMLPFFEQAAQGVETLVPEGDEEAARRYKQWANEQRHKFKSHDFNGTVHCEASLMAAVLDPTTGAGECVAQFFKASEIFVDHLATL